ncbi:vWA domain-containing protein [Candidatus Magnetominusculus dajiuhuensis]|uniref:vWA domain-containing protein n=1 Tax=Candidatus Magnetominusculus dajiuhuensis TaxID=3137712 RepID=UPI003B42BF1B
MYDAEISRSNPGCFLFLIDQSGSMSDPFGGSDSISKSHGVADTINKLIANLVLKCTKDDGIRDYFEVGVIGYGNPQVSPAFSGVFAGQELIKVEALGNNPLRIEERMQQFPAEGGGTVERPVKFPIWFEPVANNATPMCKAISYAKTILERWSAEHADSYPPIAINITDGDSTDGNPIPYALDLYRLGTNNGNVLFFNIHISSQKAIPILYPDTDAQLPDQLGRSLFEMSSMLPEPMMQAAQKEGYNVLSQSRGFGFNADLVSLIKFIDIGTRVGNLR